MRLYFVPVDMQSNMYFNRSRENYDFETMSNLERIFDDYQGEWLIFDNMEAAKKHTAIVDTPKDFSSSPTPIYELEAHSQLTCSKEFPFKMHLNPTELRAMTLSRKDLLSVTTYLGYFPLNRDLLESREIKRLRKYLFSFELNDRQKKAALELVNCLTALKGKDRDPISSVVDMSINYVGYRHITTKESYEKRAEWYLTQSSEGLQRLGKVMLAFTIVFAILAAGLMAVTSSISIPAIVVIPTIGLLSVGLFASGCRHQTRLSSAMHGFANTFETLPDAQPIIK